MPDTPDRTLGVPNPAQSEQAAEQKMRRALGLNSRSGGQTAQQRPEQARARHRFVQDGGVPVVMLNARSDESAALRERIAELTSILEAERAAHAGTRRSMAEQASAHQALQTRMAHAELAHNEALQQAYRARDAAQEALAAAAIPPRRGPGRPRLHPLPAAPSSGPTDMTVSGAPDAATATADDPPRRKPGRPRTAPPKEPKPVRWWTPSFRAKGKG